MRLWHKDLIAVLPNNQLRGQWRECCLIAKGLHDNNLNHILVNKVKRYPLTHLAIYGFMVYDEMRRRGYSANLKTFTRYMPEWFDLDDVPFEDGEISTENLFSGWHNDRYLRQCYYNLQEKYDCGGIPEHEWRRLEANIDNGF